MSEHVLVTGGTGFIGSHASAYFAEKGYDVTVLDNCSRAETLDTVGKQADSSLHNWAYLEREYPEIELRRGDVRDGSVVRDAVDGCDGIVHTAGQVAVTSSLADPKHDQSVNVEGTLTVLEAAREAESDPTVVFASTNKVYGNNVNEIPTAEREKRYVYDDPDYAEGIPETLSVDGTEHTPYGVSKLAADMYVQDYARRDELDAAVFRMSCIYGERQFGSEDQGWVAHFLQSTLDGDPLTIYGDGKQVRDALHVSDLVRAYDAFLSEPEGKPTVYNIGGGPENTTSLVEFLDLLEDETGKRSDVTFEDWREGDQRVYISDISRAKTHLDWEPTVSLTDGVDRFLDWDEKSRYLGQGTDT